MKIKYKVNPFYIVFMLLGTISSCEKFLEANLPPTKISTEDVFSSDVTAASAVMNIYADFLNRPSFASGDPTSISSFAGLLSDELVNFGMYDMNTLQFESNEIKSNNAYVLSLWSSLYGSIYRTNLIREQLEISTTLSEEVKNQLTGEVLFARAFCYFYLVNLYGNVPLVLTSDYTVNSVIGRTESAKIYEQIISDLTSAQELLADNYVARNGERIRPNKYTATALKSRVYLYTKDWQNAEEMATEIINNSSVYSLKDDLNTVFLRNSIEAIWQLMPTTVDGTGITNEASTFSPDEGIFNYNYIRTGSVNGLDQNDLRVINWLDAVLLDADTMFYPTKYKQYDGNAPLTEYSMVFRLAEQYLIRAEARAMQNKITGLNSAEEDINVIRDRANLLPISGSSPNSIIDAIMEERRIELLTEWGHRWFDLKRTGRANNVLSAIKPEWQITDTLLPLPQGEMTNNPLLKPQNTGY